MLKSTKKLENITRNALLAGVGAYEAGREQAASKFDQLFVEGSALVNELVAKGESLEAQLQAKLQVRQVMDSKIAALRATFGFRRETREQQLEQLSQRVDNLIDVVAKLAHQKATAKKAAEKAVAEKAAEVKAQEPAPAVKAAAATPAPAKAAPAVKKPVAKKASGKTTPAKTAVNKSATASKAAVKKPSTKTAVTTDKK
ncbi:MAG: hypothetical protein GW763_07560 [Paraglaciecola sp.]|nr:hypothetical protein [Paraglaciecola sp.]NCT47835.1 hypothetical protein [Paraglaciecola sp.]